MYKDAIYGVDDLLGITVPLKEALRKHAVWMISLENFSSTRINRKMAFRYTIDGYNLGTLQIIQTGSDRTPTSRFRL